MPVNYATGLPYQPPYGPYPGAMAYPGMPFPGMPPHAMPAGMPPVAPPPGIPGMPPTSTVPPTHPVTSTSSTGLAPGEVLPPKGLMDTEGKLGESSSSSTIENSEPAKPLDPLEAFARELMEEGRRARQQQEKHRSSR